MQDLNKLIKIASQDEKERALMRAILTEFSINCKPKCATKLSNLLGSFGENSQFLIVKSAKAIADRLLCRDYTDDEPRITAFLTQHLSIKADYIRSKLSCDRKLSSFNSNNDLRTIYGNLLKSHTMSPVIAAAVSAIIAGVPDDEVAKAFNLTKAMLKYVKRKASEVEVKGL
jgi:hypothetical protein